MFSKEEREGRERERERERVVNFLVLCERSWRERERERETYFFFVLGIFGVCTLREIGIYIYVSLGCCCCCCCCVFVAIYFYVSILLPCSMIRTIIMMMMMMRMALDFREASPSSHHITNHSNVTWTNTTTPTKYQTIIDLANPLLYILLFQLTASCPTMLVAVPTLTTIWINN